MTGSPEDLKAGNVGRNYRFIEHDVITRAEFQNWREDVKEEFKRNHECNQRIEAKLDKLLDKESNFAEKHEEQVFDLKSKLIMFGATSGLSTITAILVSSLNK